jgi:AcrR family transcriptional regulator
MENLSRREKERQIRESEIVAAAEKIFYLKGYDEASMDEIAKEAQFTKRTVYQYFINKDDLYYAVALKGFKQMFSYAEASLEQGKTGFEKLCLASRAYYQFYQDHPDIFRVMNCIGFVKSKNEISPKRQEFMQFDQEMFQKFAMVIEKGKADGSIRTDLETSKAAYAFAFMTTGFFHLLSITGKTFIEHFALEQEDFVSFVLGLFSDAFRAQK